MFRPRVRRACFAVMSAGVLQVSLCFNIAGENGREFREMAVPGLQSGLSTIIGGLSSGDAESLGGGLDSIFGGVLDGFAAMLTPDGSSGSTGP